MPLNVYIGAEFAGHFVLHLKIVTHQGNSGIDQKLHVTLSGVRLKVYSVQVDETPLHHERKENSKVHIL